MDQDFIIGMITACRAQMKALDLTLGILEKEFEKQRAAVVDDGRIRCPKCGSESLAEFSTMGETRPQFSCRERHCDFTGVI